MGGGRHSIVKNTGEGGWLDSLGSGILVRKRYLKNIDLDNSEGVAKMIHMDN